MPGTLTYKVGQPVMVFYPGRVDKPTSATICAITRTPGKTLGVRFEEPTGRHSCDGACPDKHGLWVSLRNVMTVDQYAERQKAIEEQEEQPADVTSLTISRTADGPKVEFK